MCQHALIWPTTSLSLAPGPVLRPQLCIRQLATTLRSIAHTIPDGAPASERIPSGIQIAVRPPFFLRRKEKK